MVEMTSVITEDEAALYDRQIRLWGVDAQRSLRAANVFVKGIGPLGAEICKNIVLSGVNSLTILDNRVVEQQHAATNFLLRSKVGKGHAETAIKNLELLNPLVTVRHTTCELDANTIQQYSVVCVTDADREEYEATNELCREHGVIFLASNTWGMVGWMFQDCGEKFKFIAEKVKINTGKENAKPETKRRKVDETVTSEYEEREFKFTRFKDTADFSSFRFSSSALLVVEGLLKNTDDVESYCQERVAKYKCKPVPADVLRNLSGDLVPICAIVGGVVSQEIIKIVSKKDAPMMNSFYYEGLTGAGIIEHMKPAASV